ncbi:MAG: VOC family protein [Dehalococcoidia bacterium]|nr:VOC family protein [Dehalococcoidia bacterium]
MAFTKVDHVAMLVDDLEVGRHVFCDGFGLAIDQHRSPWPEGRPGTYDGVTSIEIPMGEMFLEISRPNDTTSEAAQFVAQHRAGMYHIAIASDDVRGDVRRLQDRGLKLMGEWGPSGVFLDPTTTFGLRIKIVPEEHYYVHPYYKGDGTITGMGHIGVAARSIEEMRTLFGQAFGLHEDHSAERGGEPAEDFDPERPASDPVHLIEFPIGGTVIEISVPTAEGTGTARLVANRAPLGATYHHIAPFAPDVRRSAAMGTAAGLQLIGPVAEPDPDNPNQILVAWFHPKTCVGTLVEVWDRPPGAEHTHPHVD